MSGFWDWLGRVIMLVLAGMITLSIIGALASISSSGSIETRLGVEPRDWPEPRPSGYEPVPAPRPETRATAPTASSDTNVGQQVVAVPKQPEPVPAAAWLEAIAYALLALVGLVALSLLLLLRVFQQCRRSADALEALASSRRD